MLELEAIGEERLQGSTALVSRADPEGWGTLGESEGLSGEDLGLPLQLEAQAGAGLPQALQSEARLLISANTTLQVERQSSPCAQIKLIDLGVSKL